LDKTLHFKSYTNLVIKRKLKQPQHHYLYKAGILLSRAAKPRFIKSPSDFIRKAILFVKQLSF